MSFASSLRFSRQAAADGSQTSIAFDRLLETLDQQKLPSSASGRIPKVFSISKKASFAGLLLLLGLSLFFVLMWWQNEQLIDQQAQQLAQQAQQIKALSMSLKATQQALQQARKPSLSPTIPMLKLLQRLDQHDS